MSKSYDNTIPLFASREEIAKAVMSIVTDSGAGIPENVFNIHRLFKDGKELKLFYEKNIGKYKILKEALIEDINAFIEPLRERRVELAKDEKRVIEILKESAVKTNEKANKKLVEVKRAIGVIY